MEKIFYADKTAYSTESAIKKILSEFYGLSKVEILKTENGKPYAQGAPYFSVTHTERRLYLAFGDTPIGIDAESLFRKPNFQPIVKKFPSPEQAEIGDAENFLKHWVIKESVVKYLGSTLSQELKKLSYINGRLFRNGTPFPANITLFTHGEYVISVCSEKDFSNADILPF